MLSCKKLCSPSHLLERGKRREKANPPQKELITKTK
jgi:hypothetical protein